MNNVEEKRAALEDLAWSATYDEDEQAVIMEAIRAYALAVHVEACNETSGNGYNGPWSYCGRDWQIGIVGRGVKSPIEPPWYCDVAKQYLPKEADD